MHVIVTKRDLLPVLDRCQGVADKKSTMPVLGNVLLDVEGPNELRLAATDLFLAVRGKVSAKVEQGGSVAVGARDLLERVRNGDLDPYSAALEIIDDEKRIRALLGGGEAG